MTPDFVDSYPQRVAARAPARPAIVCGERRLDYAELARRTRQLANGLAASQLPAGTRVAWLGHNAAAYAEVLLGTAAARMVLVPVNWRLATPEIRALLDDATPAVVFCSREFLPLLHSACDPARFHRVLVVDDPHDYEPWLAAQDAAAERTARASAPRSSDDCFLQLYTSGTTGVPKGVCLSHRAFLARRAQEAALGAYYAWQEHETILVAAPLFHVGGSGWLLQGLHNGATCVIHPGLDPQAMLEAVDTHRIRRLFAPPVVVKWMIERQRAQPVDLSCLALLLYGSAPIPPATLREALAVIPHCGFMHHYGMTEMAGSQVCMAPAEHDPCNASRLLSCGRPMPGVELRIVDEHGTTLPAGSVGEIELRSEARMLGYWNRPQETARAFHDGWYRSGDAGRLDPDGFLYIVDRVKDMIVTGGENVYPVEVENALHEHPAIALCAVIGRPHDTWGEAVHAVVRLRPGMTATVEELVAFLRPRIAGFKIPRSCDFVDEMPMTSSGKISKVELRRPYWAQQQRGIH